MPKKNSRCSNRGIFGDERIYFWQVFTDGTRTICNLSFIANALNEAYGQTTEKKVLKEVYKAKGDKFQHPEDQKRLS
jgi:hypothetical protein